MAPGLLLSAPLSGEGFLARLPAAFALSTGLFGLLALPVLLSHRSLDLYLALCGGVVALSLISAAVLLGRGAPGSSVLQRPAFEAGYVLLLVLFLAVAGVLAAISVTRVPGTGEDAWVYLSYIREYLAGGGLGVVNPYTGQEYGGFTRLTLNGWLVVEAALARACGLDPIALVGNYLTPVLVVASLLAFYALARTVTGGSRAALFASILYALPFLATLDYSLLSAGGEFVGRVTEDKFLARFVFLPVALIFAVKFLEESGSGSRRRWRHLLLFAFLSYAAVVVHPLGFALIGLAFAAAAPVHLILSRRERAAWTGVLALGAVLLGAAVPALLYFLLQTGGVPSMLEATSENRTAFLLYAWERGGRLLRLGEGSFIMHPSLLLQPAVLGAYLIGLPHLFLRAKGSVPARFLLGNLLLMPVLLYVPPIATFVGGIVGPWTLWRLAWPLQLAAALALGWALWDLFGYARRLAAEGRPGGFRAVVVRGAAALLPAVFLISLLAAVSPLALQGARSVRTTDETAQGQSLCTDPALRWLDGELKEPGVVLTPGNESRCLAAQAAHARVTNLRELAVARDEEAIEQDLGREIKVSSVTKGTDEFYRSPTVDREMLSFLRRRKVDLVLLPVDSPLVAQLDHLPGFERLEAPGERYVFYGVSWRDLAVGPIVGANTWLNGGEYDRAIEAYAAAPSRGPGDDFLALLGTGRAHLKEGRYAEAEANLEEAVGIDPGSTSARGLLAKARADGGDVIGAREAYEEAIRRNPRNVQIRLDYGLLLLASDPAAAIEEHREVVRMYPEVPEYRIKLGGALGLLGHPREADRELAKAVEIDPLSPRTHADLGKVYGSTGRPWESVEHYERALALDPQNQAHAYELGRALAGLSAEDPGDERLFERAEENLKRVDDLQPLPRDPDNRAAAQLALGDLYAAHDRPADARRAYEEAPRLDPELEERAREKIQGLEGS